MKLKKQTMNNTKKLSEIEKSKMEKYMKNNEHKKSLMPEKNKDGVYIYNKDNVPFDMQLLFMPSMMSVLKQHIVTDDNGHSYFSFNYESNMVCNFEEEKITILIDVEKNQISAHFCIMLLDMDNNEKYVQPFSFYLDFDDISEFSVNYYQKKTEMEMSIEMTENTIKTTKKIKRNVKS